MSEQENVLFPEVPNFDETDVENALERQTDDGKGDDDPDEGDFDSYATDGVEQGDNQ
jgi:hypothetical protein